MKLQHIELKDLKLSDLNVRKHGQTDELDELAASIRSLGVIQPLLVRPNGKGFEVVAGQRRLLACQAIEAEHGKIDPLPCAILEDGDDATAIEASLAENLSRLPMDEIDQYEAFAALKKQGGSIADIASRFGVTELLVTKRLAIADLIPGVLTAYRNSEIDVVTLRALTMATKKQQKAWMKLLRDPEQWAPTGDNLKAWLFGGQLIPESSALFPLERYDGVIVTDLFDEERYFDDHAKFWKLQTEVLIKAQAAYLEAGWNDVEIMDIGKHWSSFDKVERSKEEGGRVYISCAADGEIGFYVGWLPEKEAARLDRAKEKAGDNGQAKDAVPQRPELTKAAMRYFDLHRQAAVRMELLRAPQIALRLIAASAITGAALWDVTAENQCASRNETITKSLKASKAQAAFDAEREAVRKLLDLPAKNGFCFLIQPSWERPDTCTLFAGLLELSDKEVLRVLTFLMAETLSAGSAQVEFLGQLLDVDSMQHWQPDEAFFELLRDKPAINAMVGEIAGKQAAAANVTGTAKTQKGIITSCLTGTNGRKKVTDWTPRYMRFPMQPYTKRKGLPAVDNGKAVSKLLAKKAS